MSNRPPGIFPRRVLMTADAVGGIWQYALELAGRLAKYQVEVVLCVMGPPPSEQQRTMLRCLENVTLREAGYRLEWMTNPWPDLEASRRWIEELIAEFSPDVLHFNGFALAGHSWGVPVVVVGHSCVLSWWQAVHGTPPPTAAWGRYREAVSHGLRNADLVVAPTRVMLRSLREHYGDFSAGCVIPNGRSACPTRAERRNQILSVGRVWDPAKNIGVLNRAAPALSTRVYVIGDTRVPDGERVEYPHLDLVGLLPEGETRCWMARSTVYAHPARYEPFGLSVLEAAQAGCALVLGDIPSLRENWEGAALFVPANDEVAWARELDRVLNDSDLQETLSVCAQERARAFSVERMAREYRECYSRAAAGGANQAIRREEGMVCVS
jgi:glycogen(starch) synthase